jgi:GPH family glycoside/pentoside/hexuronide:cation symporter
MVGLCVAGTYRRYWQVEKRRPPGSPAQVPLWRDLASVFHNYAFRQVLGLYFCAWMAVQVTAAMLPYFVGNWMGLPAFHFAQMALAVQGTAMLLLGVWHRLARHSDKRTVFLLGAPLAMVALFGLGLVQPGQIGWMYGLAIVAGMGVATLYMMPFAMLPDVVDLDQLHTGQRREGLYFSALVFLQKLGLALALFVSGQVLSWTGFIAQASPQPPSALWAIRLLIGPLPGLLLLLSLIFAYRYPISRDRHRQILTALAQKQERPENP